MEHYFKIINPKTKAETLLKGQDGLDFYTKSRKADNRVTFTK